MRRALCGSPHAIVRLWHQQQGPHAMRRDGTDAAHEPPHGAPSKAAPRGVASRAHVSVSTGQQAPSTHAGAPLPQGIQGKQTMKRGGAAAWPAHALLHARCSEGRGGTAVPARLGSTNHAPIAPPTGSSCEAGASWGRRTRLCGCGISDERLHRLKRPCRLRHAGSGGAPPRARNEGPPGSATAPAGAPTCVRLTGCSRGLQCVKLQCASRAMHTGGASVGLCRLYCVAWWLGDFVWIGRGMLAPVPSLL